jgi:subtilase family serine protease
MMNGVSVTATVAQGLNVDFSYSIKNNGTAASDFSNAAYMFDQKPDPTHYAGFKLVNQLAVGGTQTLNASYNTAGLSVGQHTLWLAADNWNQVGDSNAANNFQSITFTVAPPLRPDLMMNGVGVTANTMQGLNLNFSYSIKNNGTAASAFSNAAYMVDQMPDPTHYAGFHLINQLAVAGIQTLNDSFNTAGLSVGQHTLWVAADNWNQVGDSNLANNFQSIVFTITAPIKPDLVVSSITAGVSVVQGNNYNFSYMVTNIAPGVPSAFSNAAYYIDQKPDPAHFAGFNLVNQLASGTSQAQNGSFDTTFLTAGSHVLWVAADNWNQAGDSNLTNNFTAVTFQVTATSLKPDLIVSAINAPSSVVQGATFNFSYDIKNVGQFYAGNSWGAFYIDTKPDAAHYVSQNPVGILLVGQSATLNTSFSAAGLSIGQHTLWVDADNQGNVAENNEANNWMPVTFTVTAPAQLASASASPAPASSPAALSGAVDTGLLTQYMASLAGSSSVSTAGMVFPDLLQAPSTNPVLAQPHA